MASELQDGGKRFELPMSHYPRLSCHLIQGHQQYFRFDDIDYCVSRSINKVNILHTLNKALKFFPHQEAVVDDNRRLTYQQVGDRIEQLAHGLTKLGLKQGDCISIIAPNHLEFYETYYAAAWLGLIANPINIRLSGSEIAYILNDAGSKLLLTHTRFAEPALEAIDKSEQVRHLIWVGPNGKREGSRNEFAYEAFLAQSFGQAAAQCPVPEDQPAHLYYTSGTTGRPKGVVLTHRNVTTHAMAAIAEFQMSDDDIWFHVAPMFHLADAWATFAVTLVGGRHVMLPEFEAAKVMAIVDKEQVTLSNLIPTMLNMMVNHPDVNNYNYSSLRLVLSGGAPIAPETVRQIMEIFGCSYIQTYGLTETSPYVTISKLKAHLSNLSEEKQRAIISRTGREFLSVSLKIIDETGNEVPNDDQTVGEVWVKGDTVTPGYWNRPEETEKAFQDGWFKTGDLAVIDREGYINIVDRKKDMIVTGGENVFSNEVEYVLYEHPAVLECAIIGVPDEKWGEAVKGVIVKSPGKDITEEELIAFVKERIGHYKAPKSIDFMNELPKTGSGKIMKRAIKARYWEDKDRFVH